jgi:predicted enzyme related to lactoylglutathione lyase
MSVTRIMPDLHADDPQSTREFYVDVLGLEVAMDLGWVVTYADPQNRHAQITVIGQDASAPVAPDVSIQVDDVDAVYAEVSRRGLEIVHPLTDEPWGVRRFFVREPTGRVLNILSHAG